MAEDHKVSYEYTGSVRSLRSSTEEAIALLNKYGQAVQKMADKGSFKSATKDFSKYSTQARQAASDMASWKRRLDEVSGKFDEMYSDAALGSKLGAGIENLSVKYEELANSVAPGNRLLRQTTEALKEIHTIVSTYNEDLVKIIEMTRKVQLAEQSVGTESAQAAEKSAKAKQQVEQATRRVAEAEDESAKSTQAAAKSHDSLTNVVREVNKEVKSEEEALSKERKTLDDKNQSLNKSSKSHGNLSNNIQNVTNNASAEITVVNVLGRAMDGLRTAAEAFTGVQLADTLWECMQQSIDLVENFNLFTVAMNNNIETGLKYVNTMQEIYGLDPSNLYKDIGYFYQLTDAIGVADEAAATMSLSLGKMAIDLSSLFNVRYDRVVENLASGMMGMSRSVRRYGFDIRTTTLQETALKYGIADKVKEMSEADRQALRYLTMVEQATNALRQQTDAEEGAAQSMGDFARNLETPANQLRVLGQQFTQLARAIGNFFVPALHKALPLINGFVMALRVLLEYLAALLGVETDFGATFNGIADSGTDAMDSVSNATDKATDSAKKAKKAIQNLLGPYDELNILSQKHSSDSGGSKSSEDDLGGLGSGLNPILAEALKSTSLQLEDISMKANKVRDDILNFFGWDYNEGKLTARVGTVAERVENAVQSFKTWKENLDFGPLGESLDTFGGVVAKVAGIIDDTLGWAFENVLGPLAKWTIEDAAPIALDLLSGALSVLAGIVGPMLEDLQKFIDIFITPLISFAGSVVVSFFQDLANTLQDLGQWIGDHPAVVEFFDAIALAIGLFVGAVELITGVAAAFEVLGAALAMASGPLALIEAFAIANPIGLIATAIAAAVVIGVELYQHWEDLGALAGKLAEKLKPVGEFFVSIIDWIGDASIKLLSFFDPSTWEFDLIEQGKDTIAGFFNGFLEWFSKPGQWVKDHVFDPLLKGIKSAFGIASPAKNPELLSAAGFVGEGFLNGLAAPFKAVGDWVKEHILNPIVNAFKRNKPDVSVEVKAKEGSTFKAIAEKWAAFKDKAATLTASAKNAASGVLNTLSNAWTTIKNKTSTLTGKASNGSSGVFSTLQNAWKAIASKTSTLTGKAVNSNSSTLKTLQSGWNAIANKTSTLTAKFNDLFTAALKRAWNGIADGINNGITIINKIPGVNISKVPKLAQGGVVTGPTMAMIGEGRYDEAVVPLGNSPQLQELVDKIANAVEPKGRSEEIVVKVYLDGREITRSQNATNKQFGRTCQSV